MLMDANLGGHWSEAYEDGDLARSWYQQHANVSAQLIQTHCPTLDAPVVDVGGGASTLVDDLLAAGYLDITVLDIAATGVDIAKKRLGKHHVEVKWIVEDLLLWQPDRRYALWHDRAVLHFLTERGDQEQYRAKLLAATDPGSVAVIGVFGPDGPTSCSGLPTTRYDSQRLRDFLGEDFVVAESQLRDHVTPAQATQQFLWSVATRVTQ